MFEPLGAKLLGRRAGRHTCWADTLRRFLIWILDSGSWILMDFGVWDFGSLILDSVLGFGVLIFDSVSCFFWLLLWCSYSYSYSINLNMTESHQGKKESLPYLDVAGIITKTSASPWKLGHPRRRFQLQGQVQNELGTSVH